MKIDQSRGVDTTQVTLASSNKTSTTNAARPTAVTNSGSGGSVKISETSRSLSAASGKTEAPFDAKRVDDIKAAISTGQFKVNTDAVADKILNSASALLTSS